MNSKSSDFDKFDAIVGKVFSVPRAEILKREKEYQRKRQRIREQRKRERMKRGAQR